MPKSRRRKPKTTVLKLNQRALEVLKRRRTAFIAKHGREPGPRDKLFDIDFDKMQDETIEAMFEVGIDPAVIYAYEKTGLLLREDLIDEYPPERVREWNAAVQEFLASFPGNDEPVDPRRRQSDLFPLSRADYEQVCTMIRAIAPTQAEGLSVAARMEFAAVVLASACSTGYLSAEAEGVAEEAPERYEECEILTLRRARELYGQGRA